MTFDRFVPNNIAQAPLAGYTDVGMRYLCAKYGCGLVVTEMVSAMSLIQKNRVAFDLLALEKPKDCKTKFAVQLFGHDPVVFSQAARFDEINAFDVIDINFGCPVQKVTRNGEGSALMSDLPLAAKIIESTVKNTSLPVTVKFRKGYSENNVNAVEFAKMCLNSGAVAVTVHGRTKEQMYQGKADLDIIKEVASSVNIPVYANGDIKTKDDFYRVVKYTRSFGGAIGRGGVGNPHIYAEITGSDIKSVLWEDIQTHYSLMLKHLPERVVACEMKKHVAAYLKNKRGAKKISSEVFTLSSPYEQLSVLGKFFNTENIF